MGWFGKKKKVEEREEDVGEEDLGKPVLPSDLEKFKLRGPFEEALEEKPKKTAPRREVTAESDLDLIMSKLDVIDARLRVIEEKLKRM